MSHREPRTKENSKEYFLLVLTTSISGFITKIRTKVKFQEEMNFYEISHHAYSFYIQHISLLLLFMSIILKYITSTWETLQCIIQFKSWKYLTKTMKLVQPIRYRLPIPTHWQFKRIVNLLLVIITFCINLCLLLIKTSTSKKPFVIRTITIYNRFRTKSLNNYCIV